MPAAIVTGGTRGIGFGIAKCLARDGYDLILGYNSNDQAAEKAVLEIKKLNSERRVYTVSGDVSTVQAVDDLFECVKTNFDNELGALVHNAGLYVGITSHSTEQPQGSLETNFEEHFLYYQKVYCWFFKRAVERAMSCKGLRHVVAISSPGCNCNQIPRIGYEAPGQAKASMELLVRMYARKHADQGVTVNCVIPGYIATDAWDATFTTKPEMKEIFDRRVNETPARRWADPVEVGDVVAFLCSHKAKFVTGAAIPVDGGLHLA